MYLTAQRSPANLGFYQRGVRSPANLGRLGRTPSRLRRRRGLRGLGDSFWSMETINPPTIPQLVQENTDPATIDLIAAGGALALSPFVPLNSPALNNLAQNAATGNLTQDQVQQAVAAETASNIAAGASPADAASQAATDVNTTLATFNAPGGAGIDWTGALPSQPGFATAALTAASGAAAGTLSDWFAANWPWLAIGGVGLFFVWRELA
jgi:hypothetical protein